MNPKLARVLSRLFPHPGHVTQERRMVLVVPREDPKPRIGAREERKLKVHFSAKVADYVRAKQSFVLFGKRYIWPLLWEVQGPIYFSKPTIATDGTMVLCGVKFTVLIDKRRYQWERFIDWKAGVMAKFGGKRTSYGLKFEEVE